MGKLIILLSVLLAVNCANITAYQKDVIVSDIDEAVMNQKEIARGFAERRAEFWLGVYDMIKLNWPNLITKEVENSMRIIEEILDKEELTDRDLGQLITNRYILEYAAASEGVKRVYPHLLDVAKLVF